MSKAGIIASRPKVPRSWKVTGCTAAASRFPTESKLAPPRISSKRATALRFAAAVSAAVGFLGSTITFTEARAGTSNSS